MTSPADTTAVGKPGGKLPRCPRCGWPGKDKTRAVGGEARWAGVGAGERSWAMKRVRAGAKGGAN